MGRGRCDCWGAKSPTGFDVAGATKPFGHGGCGIPSSGFAVVFESFVEEEAGGSRWFFHFWVFSPFSDRSPRVSAFTDEFSGVCRSRTGRSSDRRRRRPSRPRQLRTRSR